jgi:hypothetical protein
MSPPGDVPQRFLEALVQQIAATRPEYLAGPFTVAEIYQDLVPYRSHRDLIGVEMNGDYQDALARLLSGEGDYLLLDSEVARRELQEELAGPNPNTALLREFAAVDVRLHPSRVPLGAGAASEVRAEGSGVDAIDADEAGKSAEDWYGELEAEFGAELEAELELEAPVEMPEPHSDERADGSPGPGRSSEGGVVGHIETVSAPPLVSLSEQAPEGADSTAPDPSDGETVCHWCREALPERDSIQFCPFCGSDLRPSPCRECGEAMEARWQFCASCGAGVRD